MTAGRRHQLEYQHRVNRVIDHIQQHRADDLSLEVLARVAGFSPFHFHRVFKAVTGENLKEYVQRVRLEWAGTALTAWPDTDVLAIALDAGFQSASTFARAFKDHFGVTATEWRAGASAEWRKKRQALRNPGQADRNGCDDATGAESHGAPQEAPMQNRPRLDVTVKTLPAQRLAYMRYVGRYGPGSGIPELWLRLARWAGPRQLWTADRLCLGIAYDDPRVTDPDKCRYDAGIVIPAELVPDAQVNVLELASARYACVSFEGTANDVGWCWDRVFAEWLPASGYQPDDKPFIERYVGDCFDEATGVVRAELCTPVRPL